MNIKPSKHIVALCCLSIVSTTPLATFAARGPAPWADEPVPSQKHHIAQTQQVPDSEPSKYSAPYQTVKPEQSVAFQAAMKKNFPLTPRQIEAIKQRDLETKLATANAPGTPPKPTSSSMQVSLAPGSTPPTIRLGGGFITSLVFVDASGAPWPVAAYDLGNPNAFNIQWDKVSNTMMIQAQTNYAYGNLAVQLRGLDTPVMISLLPGKHVIDYRVDLRIQKLTPHSQEMLMTQSLPSEANATLMSLLDGVPPEGAKALHISGAPGQAWSYHEKLLLRTRFNVLSPGWISTMSSPDGTKVYEMEPAPVVLLSLHGRVVHMNLQGLQEYES